MSIQKFYINRCHTESDVVDMIFEAINSAVERPNSDMEDEDCCEITVEFLKGDE